MKKKILLCVIAIIIVAIIYIVIALLPYKDEYFDESKMPNIVRNENAWYSKTNMIAHAGGIFNNLDHTNSKEAIESFLMSTVDEEIRVVELDFDYTSDNVLVCSHLYRDKGFRYVPTYEEYMSYDKDGFTPMDFNDVIKYMENNSNLYIMVDTKVEQHTDKTIVDIAIEMINKIPNEYKDRLIFQLYYPKQKEQMMKIYNFKEENLVLSLYKGYPLINDALKDAYNYHFSVILFNKKFFNDDELQRLINKNFVLVVYTVNKQNEKDKLLDKGITVTITDNLY
jgi:glycerophosphoryl diester phosphodiesterase